MAAVREILRAQSCATDTRAAVAEFHAAVARDNPELVIFFCSKAYDLDVLAAEMRRLFAGVEVVGCTTAGEIGPAGYRDHSLTGASFPAGTFTAVTARVADVHSFKMDDARALTQPLLQRLETRASGANSHNTFALLLVDGLSLREEAVTRELQHALGNIALFGGSAGDGLDFGSTQIYYEGHFRVNGAVLIVATTTLPFRIFKTQHFVATEQRLVVTEADPDKRLVKEIDGFPAAEQYARLVGVDVNDLNSDRFAASPLVVQIDGTEFVRAIQKAHPDGSLTLFCAIDEGLVLRTARGLDLVQNLESTFEHLRADIGEPQLVLACDCVLRNLESVQRGNKGIVGDVFRRNNAIGFSTYGEQFHGVHVNQTLTGIAIGHAEARRDG
jgi:hypothetical protein